MKNKQKRGITIVTLVITIIILIILTAAVMLTANDSGIFGQAQDTVNEHNKQVGIEKISLDIEAKMIEKIHEKGRYEPLTTAEIIEVMKEHGAYDEATMMLTLEEGVKISLFEIAKEEVNEYVDVKAENGKLVINTQLPSDSYVIEYSTNGATWQEYTGEVQIGENANVEVRVTDKNGNVVSNSNSVIVNKDKENLVSITAVLNKTTYVVGETISTSDITVTARYDNGKTKQVTNYIYSPTEALTVDDRSVTISYTENGITKQASKSITVNNILKSIAITELKKTNYKQGEIINKSDIVVMATYEDNSTKQVTNFTYTPTGILQSSNSSITVTYTEGEITKQASTNINVTYMTGIEITGHTEKTTYIKGENFDTTDLIVSAYYANGDVLPVTGYQIVNGTNLQVGTTEVVIRYAEGGITMEDEIAITVTNNITGIAVTNPPDKTTYNHDEEFDKTGMVITATYQDKTTIQLEENEYTVSTPTYGQNYVTITHTETGMRTTQAITVNRVLASITVATPPTKTIYKLNDNFEANGMVVKATYTDSNVPVEIVGYQIINGTNLQEGTNQIRISYTENEVTKETYQGITVDVTKPTAEIIVLDKIYQQQLITVNVNFSEDVIVNTEAFVVTNATLKSVTKISESSYELSIKLSDETTFSIEILGNKITDLYDNVFDYKKEDFPVIMLVLNLPVPER